uniref:Cytochrome b n=1 Tax=Eimeria sp. TaxID=1729940 RepID=A0A1X9IFT3_9EIME|nr:cytochrome b [Eimeria sp.]AOX48588.1 cytochrome b [Eimeria sp.]
MTLVRSHLQSYPCPSNLNFLWNFGFLLAISFVIQLITGLLLATRYTSEMSHAFASVQHIMREVSFGWEFRFLHATGASCVFLCLFMHILRALYISSYTYHSRGWITGLIIYFISIATGFLGYVLPWGQMSFWGATVICNLLSPIPYLVTWLLGGFYVDNPTLRRFFVLHFILPFAAFAVIFLHIFYIHSIGSSNPLGTDTALKLPFYPYIIIGDLKYFNYLIFFLLAQSFFGLIELSHPDNSIPVNRFVTPLQIVPEWYYLAYYAILKVIPSKTGGLLLFVGSILLLLLLSEIRSFTSLVILRQQFSSRNCATSWSTIYIYSFIALIIIGAQLPQEVYISYGRFFTVIYLLSTFSFFKL